MFLILFLSASLLGFLRKQLQSAPIPPLVPKTRGVKDPIS